MFEFIGNLFNPGTVWGYDYKGTRKRYPASFWSPEQMSYLRDGKQVYRYGVQHQEIPEDWLQPANDKPIWMRGR
jgi:hypothetical protein